jgi:hypothetical protein
MNEKTRQVELTIGSPEISETLIRALILTSGHLKTITFL